MQTVKVMRLTSGCRRWIEALGFLEVLQAFVEIALAYEFLCKSKTTLTLIFVAIHLCRRRGPRPERKACVVLPNARQASVGEKAGSLGENTADK